MRREIHQGTLLGFKCAFLHELSSFVICLMKDAYPEFLKTRGYVSFASPPLAPAGLSKVVLRILDQ